MKVFFILAALVVLIVTAQEVEQQDINTAERWGSDGYYATSGHGHGGGSRTGGGGFRGGGGKFIRRRRGVGGFRRGGGGGFRMFRRGYRGGYLGVHGSGYRRGGRTRKYVDSHGPSGGGTGHGYLGVGYHGW